MALETFLSTAEIDALFESSYLSYVSQMKSTVNLQNSTFEPASARSRKRKRNNLEERVVLKNRLKMRHIYFLPYLIKGYLKKQMDLFNGTIKISLF